MCLYVCGWNVFANFFEDMKFTIICFGAIILFAPTHTGCILVKYLYNWFKWSLVIRRCDLKGGHNFFTSWDGESEIFSFRWGGRDFFSLRQGGGDFRGRNVKEWGAPFYHWKMIISPHGRKLWDFPYYSAFTIIIPKWKLNEKWF